MKTMTSRGLALLVIRLMVVWFFLSMISYALIFREVLGFFVAVATGFAVGSFRDATLFALFYMISLTVWILFALFILGLSYSIINRIVSEDRSSVEKSGLGVEGIMRLVIVCIGIQIGILAMHEISNIFSTVMTIVKNGAHQQYFGHLFAFPVLFPFSLVLILRPDKVLRCIQRFQKGGPASPRIENRS